VEFPNVGQRDALFFGAMARRVLLAAGALTCSFALVAATCGVSAAATTQVLAFTEPQVQAMARAAADRNGIAGTTLDATFPLPKGAPPLSYLLAAWVTSAKTPGAMAVRAAMGRRDWTHAPSVVFPAAALALFVADVTNHTPTSKGTTATTARTSGLSGSSSASVVDVVNAPCSLVSDFIQGVLNTAFAALKLQGPTGTSTVEQVGAFFVSIYNVAVSYVVISATTARPPATVSRTPTTGAVRVVIKPVTTVWA
jgi:hypothetical protein